LSRSQGDFFRSGVRPSLAMLDSRHLVALS